MVTIENIIEVIEPSNSKDLQYAELKTAEDIKEALEKSNFLEKSRIILYCLDNYSFSRISETERKNDDIKNVLKKYASILLLIKGVNTRGEQDPETIKLFERAILEYGE